MRKVLIASTMLCWLTASAFDDDRPPQEPMPQDEFAVWAEEFIDRLPDRSKLTMRLAEYRKSEHVVKAALEAGPEVNLTEVDNTLAGLEKVHDLRTDIMRTHAIADDDDLKLLRRLGRRSWHKHFDDNHKTLVKRVAGLVAAANEYADLTHRTRAAIEGAQRAYERKVATKKTRSQGRYGNPEATKTAKTTHRARVKEWAAGRDRKFDTILDNMQKRKRRIEGTYDKHIMWLFKRSGRSSAVLNVTEEQRAAHFADTFDLDEYVRAVREGKL